MSAAPSPTPDSDQGRKLQLLVGGGIVIVLGVFSYFMGGPETSRKVDQKQEPGDDWIRIVPPPRNPQPRTDDMFGGLALDGETVEPLEIAVVPPPLEQPLAQPLSGKDGESLLPRPQSPVVALPDSAPPSRAGSEAETAEAAATQNMAQAPAPRSGVDEAKPIKDPPPSAVAQAESDKPRMSDGSNISAKDTDRQRSDPPRSGGAPPTKDPPQYTVAQAKSDNPATSADNHSSVKDANRLPASPLVAESPTKNRKAPPARAPSLVLKQPRTPMPAIIAHTDGVITEREFNTPAKSRAANDTAPDPAPKPPTVKVTKPQAEAFAEQSTQAWKAENRIPAQQRFRLPKKTETSTATIWREDDQPTQPNERKPFGLVLVDEPTDAKPTPPPAI
ncbi:MAG: hypothetical protein ACOYOF_16845, partial [Verrucomicrobiaceae bacterium]